jgi:peptidoglycan hydrolase-like protein with peptidoglycan-binding domain
MKTQKLRTILLGGAFGSMLFLGVAFALPAHADLTSTLRVGSRGTQVTQLQNFLSTSPAIYPEALVTGYFGSLTKAAVIRFQNANQLVADGIVGPITRARINTEIGEGGMGNGADIIEPSISNLMVNSVTASSATFTWYTGENSVGKIYYSNIPLTGYDSDTAPNGFVLSGTIASENNATSNHSLTISGLSSHTTYYYRAISIDGAGNAAASLQGSIVTQ